MPFETQDTPCPTKFGFKTIQDHDEPKFKPRNLSKEFIVAMLDKIIEECEQDIEDNPFI